MLTSWLALAVLQTTPAKPDRPPAASPLCVRVLEPRCGKVHDVDVSADGERVLVGCEHGNVLVYELATGQLLKDVVVDTSTVWDVEFDATGERFLAVQGGCTRIWNAKSFAHENTLRGQLLGMLRATFSADGRLVASGSVGNGAKPKEPTEARVWDAETGMSLALVPNLASRVLPGFSPDGRSLLASSGSVAEMFVLELTGKRRLRTLKGHTAGIAHSVWSPDGKTILSVSSDLTGRLWNVETGNVLHVLSGHTGYMYECEFSPDGKEVSTTSWADRTTRVWGVKSGKERLILEGHLERPTAVSFAPDGRTIASFDAGGVGILFELERGTASVKFVGHTEIVSSVEFSPDSKRIVTGSYDGTVRVWSNPRAKP